jgi:hypothetical protein
MLTNMEGDNSKWQKFLDKLMTAAQNIAFGTMVTVTNQTAKKLRVKNK